MSYGKDSVVLLETKLQQDFTAPAQLPSNIAELYAQGGIANGVLGLLTPGLTAIAVVVGRADSVAIPDTLVPPTLGVHGVLGGFDTSRIPLSRVEALGALRRAYGALEFRTLPSNPLKTTLAVDVVVLRRDDGTLDVALDIQATYSTAYNIFPNESDPATLHSLYRDFVRIDVAPRDPSLLRLVAKSVAPTTTNQTASYQYSNTWTIGGGFTMEATVKESPEAKVGFNASGSYTFSVASSITQPDFDVVKGTGDQSVIWSSRLRNVYDNWGLQAVPYGLDNPEVIISRNAFTQWLKGPPPAACQDFDRAYLCAFSVAPEDAQKARYLKIDLTTQQRLQHAEIVGRWGAPGARMGGSGTVVPALFNTAATLVIDMVEKTAKFVDPRAVALNIFETIDLTIDGALQQRELVSLRSHNLPDHYVRRDGDRLRLARIEGPADRRDATFVLLRDVKNPRRARLAAPSSAGLALTRQGDRLVFVPTHGARPPSLPQFDLHPGFADDKAGVTFQFDDLVVRHRDYELHADPKGESDLFRKDATFYLTKQLA